VRLLALASLLVAPALLAADPAPGPFEEGVKLVQAGKGAEAHTYFTAAAQAHPESPIPPYWLGRLALSEEDWDKSIDWFEKTVELEDGNSMYHLWLGRAIGQKAQRASVIKQAFLAKKVKTQFERAVELDGKNLEARSDLISYYLMAPGVMGGSVEKAKEQAAAIAAQDAYQGHLAAARIHADQKEDGPYEREMLAAAAARPDDPNPRFQLGFLYQRLERWDDAFRTFDELVKNDKVRRNALYQVGRTGALSGKNLEHAAESIEAYIKETPGQGEPPAAAAHFRLAQVYEKLGRLPQARTELETTLRLDPKHAEAKKALEKLPRSS
jgi:tetratricopeptide (TPR) repeat protein